MEKYTGIIKFYNPPKRYGFIKYLYRDKDIFFHISSVDSAPEKICKDIVVSFLTDTKNGKERATNITVVADGKLETVRALDDHIERIIDIADNISPNRLTILTGSNGSGKSFVRKLMNSKMSKKFPNENIRKLVSEISMQKRTDVNNSLIGTGFGFMFFDDPRFPTSISTFNLINKLLCACFSKKENKSYIIIDEPEIGMADESQLGIAQYLKENLPKILENSLGIMVITHSKVIVRELRECGDFYYIDKDMTVDEWLNREIKPTDLERLREKSVDLMNRLNDWLI